LKRIFDREYFSKYDQFLDIIEGVSGLSLVLDAENWMVENPASYCYTESLYIRGLLFRFIPCGFYAKVL